MHRLKCPLLILLCIVLVAGCGKGDPAAREAGASAFDGTPPVAESAPGRTILDMLPPSVPPVELGAYRDGIERVLYWREDLPGDYNRDGRVEGLDLFPLASRFNEESNYGGHRATQPGNDCIDGNRDGQLNGLDLFVISTNFNREVTGYNLYRSVEGGGWELVADSPFTRGAAEEAACRDRAFYRDEKDYFLSVSYRATQLGGDGESDYSDVLEDLTALIGSTHESINGGERLLFDGDGFSLRIPDGALSGSATVAGGYADYLPEAGDAPVLGKLRSVSLSEAPSAPYDVTLPVSAGELEGGAPGDLQVWLLDSGDLQSGWFRLDASEFNIESLADGSALVSFETDLASLYAAAGLEMELSAEARASVLSGPEPLIVDFDLRVRGGEWPWSFNWDFDDGDGSNQRAPRHVFLDGEFDVSCTVTDNLGTEVQTAPIHISVSDAGVDGEAPYWLTTTGVQAAVSHEASVTLFFNAAADAETPPVRFNVYRDTISPVRIGAEAELYEAVEIASADPDYVWSCTVEGLTNDEENWFVVRAIDSAVPYNEDDNLVELSAVPSEPPPVPTGLVAECGFGRVELSWDEVIDAELDGYRVYVRQDEPGPPWTFAAEVDGADTTYTWVAPRGTWWHCAVSAVDVHGSESQLSETADAWSCDEPGTPLDLTAVSGDGQISLSWAEPSEGEAVGYNVYRASVSGGPYAGPVNAEPLETTAFIDDSLANESHRWYVVRALNGFGLEGQSSNEADAWASAAPAVPGSLTAHNGNASVGLDWNANTEPDFSHYDVFRSDAEEGTYALLNLTPLFDADYDDLLLTNEMDYWYKVRATDDKGVQSALSAAVLGHPSAPPSAPTGFEASGRHQSAWLNWNDNPEPDVAGYRVYRSTGEFGFYTRRDPGGITGSEWMDTGLTNGDTLWYKVLAVDQWGVVSPFSAADSATPNPAPAAPTGLAAASGDGEVALNWDDNSETDFDHYDLYRSATEFGTYAKLNASDISLSDYDDSSVVNENTYWYKALAVDATGNESPYSEAVSASPSIAPAAPTGLTALGQDNRALLDWSDNSEPDLSHYDVFRSTTMGGTYTQINSSDVSTSDYVDDTITNGSTWWYKVRAVDDSGVPSALSSAAGALPNGPPAIPSGLAGTPGDEQIALDWTDNGEGDFDHYDVYRSLSQFGTYSKINASDVDLSEYLDSNLTNDTTYWYKLKALDTSGNESGFSLAASASPSAAPAAPAGLTAIAGNGQVALDWNDNVESDFDHYDVYRSDSETGTYTKINPSDLAASAYTDSSATNENTYWYKAKAVDDYGVESAFSSAVSAHPSGPPAAPTGLAAVNGDGEVALDWNDNSETDLNHYDVYRSLTENGTYSKINAADVTMSDYTDSSVTNETDYWYKVLAVDDYGVESPLSSAVQGRPSAAPSAPSGLAITPGNAELYLDWSDNSETDFDHYDVYRALSESGSYAQVNSSDLTLSEFTDSPLTNETTYWYKLVATDDYGVESAMSSAVSGTPSGPPATPTGLNATNGDGEVLLDWNDNSETDLDHYDVYRATSESGTYAKLNATDVTTSAYTDSTATNETTWWYKVLAVDTYDVESPLSSAVSAHPSAAASAPTGLSAANGDGEVYLDWNDNSESDLAYYDVYRSTTESGTYVKINASDVTASWFTDNTVTNENTYWYKVLAVDDYDVESPLSSAASAQPSAAPAAPTGLAAVNGSGQVSLDWDDNSETDLDYYDVYRATSAGGPYAKINVSGVTSSQYTDSSVTNETDYWYKVLAVDDYGIESPLSSAAQAHPSAPPSAPTGLGTTNGDGQVSLDWNDNSETDLAYYDVYRSLTENGPYSKINSSDVLTSAYLDSSVTNETTYWYKVLAVDDYGIESPLSSAAGAHPSAAPAAPAGMNVVNGNAQVAVDWNDNFESDLDYYDIYRSATEFGTYAKLNASDLSSSAYTDSSVVNENTYWYKTKAIDDYGVESAFSSAVKGEPSAPPAAPTGLAAVSGNGEVDLDWNDNSETDFDHYDVWRSLTESGTYTRINASDVTTSDYNDSTVTNETTYWYKLSATDDKGVQSALSSAASAFPNGPPAAPTGLGALNGNAEVDLDWNDNAESDIDHYDVYRSLTESGTYSKINTSDVATSAYNDDTPTNETDYWYKVLAVDTTDNESPLSSAAQGHPSAPPAAPTGLSTTNGDGEVSLDWNDNSETDFDHYDVWRATSQFGSYVKVNASDVTVSAYTDSAVTNETTYWYKLKAVDDYGVQSAFSTEANSHPSAAPSAPTGLSTVNGDEQVDVDWNDNAESDFDHYDIYRSTSESGTYVKINVSDLTASAFGDTGLTNEDTYWYKVKAIDIYDIESAFSSAVSGHPSAPPAAPTGLAAVNGNGEVDLDWDDNSETDFDHYDVYRSTTETGTYVKINVSDVTTSAFNDNTVTNDNDYWYKVLAVDDYGVESPLSSAASAHPSLPPAAPTGLSYAAGFQHIKLDWNDNAESDIGTYDVYRSSTETGTYTQIASGLATSDHRDWDVSDNETWWYKVRAVDIYGIAGSLSAAASGTAGEWVLSTVESSGEDYGRNGTCLKFDASDYPGISYRTNTVGSQRFARWNGSSWDTETVEGANNAGYFSSLEFDTSDEPLIVQHHLTTGMKSDWYDGSSWDVSTIYADGSITAMDLDSSGHPSVSFRTFTLPTYAIRVARHNGTSWSTVTVTSGSTVLEPYTSIAIDSSGDEHVSFSKNADRDLMYAAFNGSTWDIETVDDSEKVGRFNSIELDGDGNPVISYHYDGVAPTSDGDLKVAWHDGTDWNIETVDSTGDVGWWSSLEILDGLYPVIAHFDDTNNDLRITWYDGADWNSAVLDSTGTVGEYCSLAFDSSGMPGISYYDGTNTALKFARYVQ